MKTSLTILTLLLSLNLHAKPVVLVSYFDPFDKAPTNSSETVAKALETKLNAQGEVEIKLCRLETKYEKAFGQLETCYKNLSGAPDLVLSLGESTCDLKIELMMKNKDKSFGPDNAGTERDNTVIIPEAPAVLGLRYPLPEMFCALDAKERRTVNVSSDAGSFVCNNMAFQMTYYYPEIAFGFIHVPGHDCRKITKKTNNAVNQLGKMIVKGVEFLKNNVLESRLPVTKKDLELLRSKNGNKEQCLSEFYQRARPASKVELTSAP